MGVCVGALLCLSSHCKVVQVVWVVAVVGGVRNDRPFGCLVCVLVLSA